MPNEDKVTTPAELRVLHADRTSEPVQVAYVVPDGKAFVLTAWTLTSEVGQPVTARLRRSKVRVAFSKISEPARAHNHLVFPTGIAFAAGDQLEIEGSVSLGQHYFYGYEIDVG